MDCRRMPGECCKPSTVQSTNRRVSVESGQGVTLGAILVGRSYQCCCVPILWLALDVATTSANAQPSSRFQIKI